MNTASAHRRNFSTGAKWEDIVGYSRAVRVGNLIFITGTVAYDEAAQSIACPGDPYGQAVNAIRRIEKVLHDAGASLRDVVRTRMFVTDISQWEHFGRAHREFFGAVRPATSMLEISRLIDPAALIEIEADAVLAPPA